MMQQMLEAQKEMQLEMRSINERVEAVAASLTARMDAIDRVQAESRVKIDENTNEIDQLKSEIRVLKESTEHYADMCEIRFGGLPDLPDDVCGSEAVASILKVLKCDESVSRIILVRKWMPSRSKAASGAAAAFYLPYGPFSQSNADNAAQTTDSLGAVTQKSVPTVSYCNMLLILYI
ncbi:hypothetical protein TKK_0000330 [Trichogramma kaykai]|uniref:Uncharacterized protein n=1 Tax=Trichogramma kaykai TaxID=54128 RepID=A0ABD2W7S8_9HYME